MRGPRPRPDRAGGGVQAGGRGGSPAQDALGQDPARDHGQDRRWAGLQDARHDRRSGDPGRDRICPARHWIDEMITKLPRAGGPLRGSGVPGAPGRRSAVSQDERAVRIVTVTGLGTRLVTDAGSAVFAPRSRYTTTRATFRRPRKRNRMTFITRMTVPPFTVMAHLR